LTKFSATLIAGAVLLACARGAHAQTPIVPPHPGTEEPLEPDRPDVTNGTHIVGTGLLQIEFGGLFTRDAPGQHAFGSPLTARIGLTEWLEARIGTDGLLTETDETRSVTGVGNLQVGAKLRLWADPGGVPVLSILPTFNFPTASAEKGLGSGDTDYTVAVLTGTDVGVRGHVDVNYGIGAIGAGGGQPHFLQQLASVSASVAFGERWDPYCEVFWYSKQDPDHGAMTAIDFGAIYTVTPRLALDAGMQFGVSRDAPAIGVFGGISVVVGDVLGRHGVHARQRSAEKRAHARAPHH
jgi:hypothetical protein